ncbi:MAG TPA: hypothetical protein VFN55_09495 [Solirubrobacteraceae bacterium]|nr:hypothetical protein [Solirubrobacteraceae bacterium]
MAIHGEESRVGMDMRRIGIVGAFAVVIGGCGSVGGKLPTASRPPAPVNMTVYVNDSRVSVSPAATGAGPVVFIVTNQSSRSEALAISRAGATHALASTAPINPQGTTQVAVNFSPGDYTITTSAHGRTDAQLTQASSIRPAQIHIGHERNGSGNQLLQP